MDELEKQFEVVDLTNQPAQKSADSPVEPQASADTLPKELAPDKSVDVFNALNLYNEELGALYENEGYNPFEQDFKLTEDFINEVLEDKKQQGEISTEEFLEKNNKTVAKNFAKAFIKNKELINKIKAELENVTDENVKAKMNKMLVTLKNRGEMLRLSIQKLKQKDANALKMYKDLFGLDSELSEILKDEFNEKVNMNNMVIRMIELCNSRSQKTKQQPQKKTKDTSNVLSTTNENTQSQTNNQENTNNNEHNQDKTHNRDRRDMFDRHRDHHHHHHDHHHDHHHGPHHDHEHGHKPPPKPEHNHGGPDLNF